MSYENIKNYLNCEGLKNVLIPLIKGWKNVPEKHEQLILCIEW